MLIKCIGGDILVSLIDQKSFNGTTTLQKNQIVQTKTTGTYDVNHKWVTDFGFGSGNYFDTTDENFRVATASEKKLFQKHGTHILEDYMYDIITGITKLEEHVSKK